METLRLPARIESLEPFREFVDRAAGEAMRGRFAQIELVLEEVLTNLVRHAYKGGDGEAEVGCETQPDGAFRLRFTDWGPPFNPLEQSAPDVNAGLEDRQIGGLGIHLVRHAADEVSYRREGGTNVLTVLFAKAPRKRPSLS